MSDPTAQKKGMRTFASDFARIKGDTQPEGKSVTKAEPKKEPLPKLSKLPKPEKKVSESDKSISKNIQKPDTPKKIPAFHEIEKTLGDIDLSGKEKKKSHDRKKEKHKKGITPSRHVGGGAIITDTKTHSFSLFGESKKGILSWFKSKKKKPTPKLAVSKAERRKGVIQEATTKSGTIFTADSETLKERIKARKLQEQNKEHDPETNWSPYTETGYSLLESGEEEVAELPATENVHVEFKKRSVPVSEPVVIPEPISKPEIKEVAKDKEPTQVVEEIVSAQMPEPIAVEPEPIAEEPETTPKEEMSPSVEATKPEPTFGEVALKEEGTGVTTNQLTMYVSGGLALALVTGFFGWTVYNNQTNTDPSTGSRVESVTSQTTTEVITVDQSFSNTQLRTFVGTTPYTEIIFANTDDELLPAALVFELTTPDIPASIQQFATDVRYVQFGNSVPQLMVSVVDPTSVTGTLLMNEAELIVAMTPIYGQINQGVFTDTSIASTDTRVLVSENQQTLTYGIVNDEVLIVAISPDAFAEIRSLLAQ